MTLLRAITYVTLLAILTTSTQAASPKRGWAGGAAEDHNASNASWYYRWWEVPTAALDETVAEFVPLIKFVNSNNLQNKLNVVANLPNSDTLLFLNEPERSTQSNVTVADALSYWPTVQQTLPNHKLVSPGVGDDQHGQPWLAEFMEEVELRNANANPNDDLRVDSIAFHWYGASSPNGVAAANSFLNRVDWYHNEYNRPVWITEFAMHDWEQNDPTEAMIQANADFLEIVLPALDSLSYVEKYSYYNWFDDARVFDETNDRMPTVIGDQYVGTVMPGEVKDLAGVSLGTDVVYLRGGTLANTGIAVPKAMRAIDSLEGINTISADTDYSISDTRLSYVRVRPNSTLRKIGPAQVELTGAISNQGTIHVEEGSVRLYDGTYSGGGDIDVEEGASLEFSFQAGRGVYPLQNTELKLAGEVNGPVRLMSGSTLTTEGSSAQFNDNLAVQNSVVEIGGAGFEPGPPVVFAVTNGLVLEYNASLDQSGDALWDESISSAQPLNFSGSASVDSVQDPAWPGITAAYSIPSSGSAGGLNGFFEAGPSGQRSRQDASFELVFHVDSTTAGTDQVLFEVGGTGSGVAFVLNNDTLTFNVDGLGGDIDLTHTLSTGWNQAVGVIDLDGGSDTMTLFVNGQQVGTVAGQNITDWAGGNTGGIGGAADVTTGVSAGTGQAFHGDIAIARFYNNIVLDSTDILQNYEALTTAGPGTPNQLLVQGDLLAETGSELRLDIGDNGAADKITVIGALSLSGTTMLTVSGVNQAPLVAGDQFDLFDVGSMVGEFDTISLPTLLSGLSWRADELASDGIIEVVLTGDLNSDGSVDAADYTIWRDSLGLQVTPYTAGDSNGDGQVDNLDLAEWQGNYGASIGQEASTIPEPTTLLLMASSLLCLLRRDSV